MFSGAPCFLAQEAPRLSYGYASLDIAASLFFSFFFCILMKKHYLLLAYLNVGNSECIGPGFCTYGVRLVLLTKPVLSAYSA